MSDLFDNDFSTNNLIAAQSKASDKTKDHAATGMDTAHAIKQQKSALPTKSEILFVGLPATFIGMALLIVGLVWIPMIRIPALFFGIPILLFGLLNVGHPILHRSQRDQRQLLDLTLETLQPAIRRPRFTAGDYADGKNRLATFLANEHHITEIEAMKRLNQLEAANKIAYIPPGQWEDISDK